MNQTRIHDIKYNQTKYEIQNQISYEIYSWSRSSCFILQLIIVKHMQSMQAFA